MAGRIMGIRAVAVMGLALGAALLLMVGCGDSDDGAAEDKNGGSWAVVESLLAEQPGWSAKLAHQARLKAQAAGGTAKQGEICFLGQMLPGEWPRGCTIYANFERNTGILKRGKRELNRAVATERRQEGEQQQEDARQREQETGEQSSASAEGRVREALGDEISSDFAVGDSEVRSVEISGPVVNVTLGTPEGGFEGASTDDTDAFASAAFAKVYEDGGWQGLARVAFRGGLIDSATGRELPNAPTASYSVDGKAARQIDWADEETLYSIDWSLYRELCHPALKGC